MGYNMLSDWDWAGKSLFKMFIMYESTVAYDILWFLWK